MTEKPDLAALLGSRICHDLISPIGAIGNGVELLQMANARHGPEVDLITESVANANARIRFFRVAFGIAGQEQRIGRAEILSILGDLTKGSRLQVVWHGPADAARREVKLIFLLILCLESALPYGGQITIETENDRWSLTGRGAKLKVDPALWEILSNPQANADIGAAQVQFALAPEEMLRLGRQLTLSVGPTEIRMTV